MEVADDGRGGADPAGGSGLRGLADRVEALGGRLRVSSPAGGGTRLRGGDPMRVVLADDTMLLREGVALLLGEAGFEVVGQAETADELVEAVGVHGAGRGDRRPADAADATPTRDCRRRCASAPATRTSACSCSPTTPTSAWP